MQKVDQDLKLMGTVTKSESFWEDSPIVPSSSHSHVSHSAVVGSLGNMSQSLSTSHNNSHHHHHYERNLNFSTVTVEDSEYGFQKKKSARDPLSHRIIEKRRRDRMNNCLADLARLLPQASLRKGRGRIEKTEIVELAIKHLKHLQGHPCPHGDNCEFSPLANMQLGVGEGCSSSNQHSASSPIPSVPGDSEGQLESSSSRKLQDHLEQFRLGYQECWKETMHFLMEREGAVKGDNFYVQLVDYLNRRAELFIPLKNILRDTTPDSQEVLSDSESETYLSNQTRKNVGNENDEPTHKMTPRCCNGGRNSSDTRKLLRGVISGNNISAFDCECDSCSSAPLSVDILDDYDRPNKNSQLSITPTIPSIIGSHSSSGSSVVLCSSNGRSADEGSASVSIPRYKFKSTIKQRFTADLETTSEVGSCRDWTTSKIQHRHPCHSPQRSSKSKKQELTNSNNNSSGEFLLVDEQHEDRGGTDLNQISEEAIDEKQDFTRLVQNTAGKMESESKKHESRLESKEKWNTLRRQCGSNSSDLSLGAPSMAGGQPGLPMITVTSNNEVRKEKLELLEERKSRDDAGLGRQVVRDDVSREEGFEGKGVPAFALHETGLFYVPLTLSRDFVSPFCIPVESAHSNPPLHPITISVCFLFGNDAPGIRSTPPDLKLTELNVQNGAAGALNLSKLNPPQPLFPYVPTSLCNSHGNPSPLIFNHFNNQPSIPSPYHPFRGDSEHSESSHFPNSSPNSNYLQFSQLNRQEESRDPDPKNGSSHTFPTFDLQNSLLVPYDQHHKSGAEVPAEQNRHSRKRHFAISSQSSASSSLSIGYHSWGDNSQSISTIKDSTNDEAKSRNSWDGDLLIQEDFSTNKKAGKSPRTKGHNTTRLKPQRNGTDKRQRKGNGS